jgi:predicted Zn-dependent peptidase
MRPASRALVGAAVLGFAARAALASALLGELEDPAARAVTTVLGNGLTVITLEDHTTPVASFQVWVKAGSRDETRYTGIAHLFEHMMFKGTRRLAPEEFTNLIEARGGRLNAWTSQDVTVYYEDVSPDALPLVIDLEAERMGNLEITQALLDSERQVVLEERRMRTEDDPEGRAMEALMGLTFQAHPYRRPVIGWRSDVEQVTVAACREFYETYYAPDNLVISVAGDFDTAAVLARIRSRFGGMRPAKVIPRSPTREPEQRGERRTRVQFDVRGPVVAVAWHAPASGHPDGPALDVLGQILSAGRSSRLYRRLVNDDQVALAAGGGYWELKDAGLFYAVASVRPDSSAERAEAILFDEIERVRRSAPREAEVTKARRKLEVDLVEELRTAHALASRVASDYVTLGRIRPIDEVLGGIQAVTADDVRRVAHQYLAPSQRNVVRVVRPEDAR